MATPFTRTVRSLATDGSRAVVIVIAAAALVFAAWGAWFVRARVALYELSSQARIERAPGPLSVDAPRGGRVVELKVALGETVARGDVLVILDSSRETLARGEAAARKTALEELLAPLGKELAATERLLAATRNAAAGAAGESKALERVASAQAKLAQREAARAEKLKTEGLASAAEEERALAEAEVRAAGAKVAGYASRRQAWERETEESDTLTRMERIRREITQVRGDIDTEAAAIARLDNEIAERTVRAIADGSVGDLPSKLRVGAVVEEGEHLLSIIPDGGLVVVADFAPATAVGRIQPGQSARVRLHGFPWTTHGMVAAQVVRVGSEARDGTVRVELEVMPTKEPLLVLEHGLAGTVEVEVEHVSPLELVLRTAGVVLSPPRQPTPAP
jgi:membrane fusion protein (multidrug efflux system)